MQVSATSRSKLSRKNTITTAYTFLFSTHTHTPSLVNDIDIIMFYLFNAARFNVALPRCFGGDKI